jgi:hypothetical protein
MVLRRHRCLWLIAGVVAAMSGAGVLLAGQALTVSRASVVTLDNQDADDILQDAKDVLFFTHGTGDVHCKTNFTRSGNVEVFNSPVSITSEADYQAVCSRKIRVNVVQDIQSCNSRPCPNCSGCSDRPGSCMVVVRAFPRKEGVLWAHEYGHNAGLCDRFDGEWVMNRSLGVDNRKVTRTECDAFEGTPAQIPTCPVAHAPDLLTYLRNDYIHGTPYEEARIYAREVSAVLRALRDPSFAPHLSNVVLTLGYIGDSAAFGPLVEYIEASGGSLTREQLVARRSAVIALGYLYFHSRDARVLRYLSEGVVPANWERRLRSKAPKIIPLLSEALSVVSVQALGIAGTPDAAKVLQSLSKTIDPRLVGVLDDSLRLNQLVQEQGENAFLLTVGQHR